MAILIFFLVFKMSWAESLSVNYVWGCTFCTVYTESSTKDLNLDLCDLYKSCKNVNTNDHAFLSEICFKYCVCKLGENYFASHSNIIWGFEYVYFTYHVEGRFNHISSSHKLLIGCCFSALQTRCTYIFVSKHKNTQRTPCF